MQGIEKVFRPLHYFYILLRCSIILQLFKLFFFLINFPHNCKVKAEFSKYLWIYQIEKNEIGNELLYSDTLLITLLKQLWQQLVFNYFEYDVTSFQCLDLGGLLPLFFVNSPKLIWVGRDSSVGSYFQVSPKMFKRIKKKYCGWSTLEHSQLSPS